MEKKITLSQYRKALTKQPYLIWHSIETDDPSSLQEGSGFSFQLEATEVAPKSFGEVQAKTFARITSKFNDFFIKEGVHLITSKSAEEQIQETKDALANDKVQIILDPVFETTFEDMQVIARPKAYNKNGTLIEMKLSGSTKLRDILPFKFDAWVIEQNNLPVKDASLWVIATQDYKKGEIEFYETKKINTNAGGRSEAGMSQSFDFFTGQLKKTGNGFKAKGGADEVHTIYEHITQNLLKTPLSEVTTTLGVVLKAQEVTSLQEVSEYDNQPFGKEAEWKEVLKQTKNKWAGYSGTLVPAKNIIAGEVEETPAIDAIKSDEVVVERSEEIKEKLEELKTKQVVWYDFEAFSLPISQLEHTLPFQQLVSQVSVIVTDGEKETYTNNMIADTSAYSTDNMWEIIKEVYQGGKDIYVVYNQGYENSRLKEMVALLKHTKHPEASKAEEYVKHIVSHTFDLAKWFAYKKDLSNLYILLPELKGTYSIKYLEKYINKNHSEIGKTIKAYSSLQVQNGMMAMEKANERALGIIGDEEWQRVSTNLKTYCENDVRAMIMVYNFVKELMSKYN